MQPVLTNCINCGAPLIGSVCTYCGTDYAHLLEHTNTACKTPIYLEAAFDENTSRGILKFLNHEYAVYIAEVQTHQIGDTYRDVTGKLLMSPLPPKHTFTLVEI